MIYSQCVPAFRVMTYNVHSCVGTDRKLVPERIAQVIERENPDVVALQELDVCQIRSQGLHQPEWLAKRLGMLVHFTSARACGDGQYGNAILSRHPFSVLSEGYLPRRRGEVRAVQWLKLAFDGFEVSVMNTHLSIHFHERFLQIRALLGAEWIAKAERNVPLIICGDFNISQYSPLYSRLKRDLKDVQLGCRRAAPTWPSRMPFWRIDHVFTNYDVPVLECSVPRDSLTKVASDHLPLIAELDLRPFGEHV